MVILKKNAVMTLYKCSRELVFWKIIRSICEFKIQFFGDDVDIQLHKDYEHIAKYPVYNFRHYLTKLGFKENNSPVPNLDLKLSPSELAEAKTPHSIVQNDKKNHLYLCYS
jgi:hypothetical protein